MIGRSATLHKDNEFHQQKTEVEEYDTLYSLILDCLNDKEMMIKGLIYDTVMKEKKKNDAAFDKLTKNKYNHLNVQSKLLRMDHYQGKMSGVNGHSINSTLLSSLIDKQHLWQDRKELKELIMFRQDTKEILNEIKGVDSKNDAENLYNEH